MDFLRGMICPEQQPCPSCEGTAEGLAPKMMLKGKPKRSKPAKPAAMPETLTMPEKPAAIPETPVEYRRAKDFSEDEQLEILKEFGVEFNPQSPPFSWPESCKACININNENDCGYSPGMRMGWKCMHWADDLYKSI